MYVRAPRRRRRVAKVLPLKSGESRAAVHLDLRGVVAPANPRSAAATQREGERERCRAWVSALTAPGSVQGPEPSQHGPEPARVCIRSLRRRCSCGAVWSCQQAPKREGSPSMGLQALLSGCGRARLQGLSGAFGAGHDPVLLAFLEHQDRSVEVASSSSAVELHLPPLRVNAEVVGGPPGLFTERERCYRQLQTEEVEKARCGRHLRHALARAPTRRHVATSKHSWARASSSGAYDTHAAKALDKMIGGNQQRRLGRR